MRNATEAGSAGGVLSLHGLRRGQRARIDAVHGPAEWVNRLREVGLRDGTEVRMLRQGPTCMIRLGYQTLCIRCDATTRVLVRPLAVAEAAPGAAGADPVVAGVAAS